MSARGGEQPPTVPAGEAAGGGQEQASAESPKAAEQAHLQVSTQVSNYAPTQSDVSHSRIERRDKKERLKLVTN